MGIDTISSGVSIGFAIEAYERGLLTKDDTGGIELKFGDPDLLVKLVEMIGKREGIGDFIAEGTKRMAEKLGNNASYFAINSKGLEFPGYETRGLKATGLSYATANRGGDHISAYLPAPEGYGLALFGIGVGPTDPAKPSREKAHLVATLENLMEFMECAIFCKFLGFGLATVEPVAKMASKCIGIEMSVDELFLYGERVWNLERCFNIREGLTRKDDSLPERCIKEPVPSGPAKGETNETHDQMLDWYYEKRGWDLQTGYPKREKLIALDLKEFADDLNL